ncbi:MAG TPA: response regulator [Opitutus sp.]|nr:response regulator [Opitutus sp.]
MNSLPGTLRPVLLAEDNANDIELILSAFQEAGLANEIVVTRDGQAAMDYLYRRGDYAGRTTATPAVVLLDLKMPRMDGREVLRQIREDAGLRSIPVVVLTSSKEESDLLQIYQLGANAYVVKPVAFDEFIGVVGKIGIFWALLNELPPPSVAV